MSPAFDARFSWYPRLFGGRQRARSLHFALLVLFVLFIAVHTLLVVVHGLGLGMSRIVTGTPGANQRAALAIGLAGLAAVVLAHVLAHLLSSRRPVAVRRATGAVIGIPERLMSRTLRPAVVGVDEPVSTYHWINGRPPVDGAYREMLASEFRDWRLSIGGLVEHPLELTLADLRAMPARQRRSLHHCIQGWSSIAEWKGVPVSELLRRCQPLPQARYAVFHGMDDKAETDHQGQGHFWEAVRLEVIDAAGAFLAYDMNGHPLPPEHGAPLRLRLDNQLGFKMVKWLHRIELVADVAHLGQGAGGWREEHQQFENAVAI
jgi:DMSO/TMAO reductase YedYZ molybdopterin-dependent catalytic subunit